MEAGFVCVYLLVSLLGYASAGVAQAKFKPCSGTTFGAIPELFGDTPAERLDSLRPIYANCTMVFGNVELVGLAADADLTFLRDVKEIVGYFLLAKTDLINVTLPNLLLIRSQGSSSYNGAALYVVDNQNLQQLVLPNLREIANNAVLISNNTNLCYVQTINWPSLFRNSKSQTSKVDINATCGTCSPTCAGSSCWSPSTCQATKFTGHGCDQDSCAAGCVNGSNTCQVCRGRTVISTSSCQGTCPSQTKTYLNRCVNTACPEPFLENTLQKTPNEILVCVPSCNNNFVDYTTRQCTSTSNGLRYCIIKGPLLHGGNIATLCGCQQLGGSLLIHNISFTGYPELGIMPIRRENLTCLSSLQQIDGYLAVVNTPEIDNLHFLKSVRRVQGTHPLYRGLYSVFISGNPNLTSLELSSLEEVDYGSVVVQKNDKLCSNAEWHTLLRKPSLNVPAVTVQNTVSQAACSYNCSSFCNQSYGCWGAGPKQCLRCAQYKYKQECVDTCNFNSVTKQCEKCNDQCHDDRCSGSNASDCTAGCKNFLQGGVCMSNCTGAHYGDSKICRACNRTCSPFPPSTSDQPPTHCTGPGNYVNFALSSGVDGCNYCKKVLIREVEAGRKLVECLLSDDSCPTNYFEDNSFLLPSPSSRNPTIPTSACQPCDKECTRCFGKATNCSACKNVREGDSCVPACTSGYPDNNKVCTSSCHHLCEGCTGPTAFDCRACTIARYDNKTSGKQQCVDTCPPDRPHYTKNDKRCILSCPAETFASTNGECLLCHPQCNDSCTSETAYGCTSCKNYFDNSTGSCVQDCPPGTFLGEPLNTTCFKISVPRPTQPTSESDSSTIGIAAGAIVGGLILLAIIVMVAYYVHHEKKRKNAGPPLIYVPDRDADEVADIPLGLNIASHENLELSVELGSGSFGTVYQSLWQRENQAFKLQVAVKVLHDKTLLMDGNEQNVEEIVSELSSIDHDHIIRTVCVCLDGEVMIGMQFMPYGSLLLFMDRRRRYMTPKALLTYSLQVAQGVSHLHSLSLIHGNLRAANILVNRPDQVKICDGALIHIIAESHKKLPIQWLAPEVLHQGMFSIASDVWSFGVTMWEILTFGSVPYEEHPVGEIPHLVVSGTRLTQPKGCTVDLYSLLLQAWINEANGRLDFPGILQKLEHFLEDPARYLVINIADLPLPKPRKRMMAGSTVQSLGEGVYDDIPELAVYHGYEDANVKDMFNYGEGLYEDPDVVQNAAYDNAMDIGRMPDNPYDNAMDIGQMPDNPYDNAPTMPRSANVIINPSALGLYDNANKPLSVVVGTPEGYEDLDKEMERSLGRRESTTFDNPSYGNMPTSGYELPVDFDESAAQSSADNNQKQTRLYDTSVAHKQTSLTVTPSGGQSSNSSASTRSYAVPRPQTAGSSEMSVGRYSKPRQASSVSPAHQGNSGYETMVNKPASGLLPQVEEHQEATGYENLDDKPAAAKLLAQPQDHPGEHGYESIDNEAVPKLLPQDSVDPEWNDSPYLPPSDVDGVAA